MNKIQLAEIKDYYEKNYDYDSLLELVFKECDKVDDLQQELQRKDNNWNELKEWLEEQHQFIIEIPAFTKEISQEHKVMECCYEDVLDKIKELEENK